MINIENVWKTYHRGATRRGDLRQTMSYWWKNIFQQNETFHALQNLNLQIGEGEVIGILGPNGAGKSTLLKLLSRITYPSQGRITLQGTVSSLLEIGIGFHPELSGRDNIYLNGVIHGMTKKEIDQQFDAIVAFSGLEDSLDMPIKQYSSGMFVRLAFSIASHLRSDILLLDEVLGVGDLAFKTKSLNRLQETVQDGRTIIMVSHQLDLLRSLCTKGVYLDKGIMRKSGAIDEVIDFYVNDYDTENEIAIAQRKDRQGNGEAIVSYMRWTDEERRPLPHLYSGQFAILQIGLSSKKSVLENVVIRVEVWDRIGQPAFMLSNHVSNGMLESCQGNAVLECIIPKIPLANGHYIIHLYLNVNHQKSDILPHASGFTVMPGQFYQTGRTPHSSRGVLIDYHWEVKES